MLLQDPNNLLFTESTLLHRFRPLSSDYERTPDSIGSDYREHVTASAIVLNTS
jgi:hypothetical protein